MTEETDCGCPGICHVHRMWKGGESLRLRDMFPAGFASLGGIEYPAKAEDPMADATVTESPSADDETDLLVQKNSFSIRISRQMAEDHGLVERSDEDARKAYEDHAQWLLDCASAWFDWTMVDGLLSIIKDPVSRLVLDQHKRVALEYADSEFVCEGCDYGGHDGAPPEWPCSTVRLVLAHHHPDYPLPSIGYDDAQRIGKPEKITLRLEQVPSSEG